MEENNEKTRTDIISTLDAFIEQIQKIRKIMLGVSISALVLAPFAIGLSVYLFTHPTFFILLEHENEFGFFLSVLLGGIIIISSIWFVTGIRQHKSLNSWNKRYCVYLKKKDQLDNTISSQYDLGEQ